MKIHAHPALPRNPFMFSIPAASKPEKAPDSDAAEKNKAILIKKNKINQLSEVYE